MSHNNLLKDVLANMIVDYDDDDDDDDDENETKNNVLKLLENNLTFFKKV